MTKAEQVGQTMLAARAIDEFFPDIINVVTRNSWETAVNKSLQVPSNASKPSQAAREFAVIVSLFSAKELSFGP